MVARTECTSLDCELGKEKEATRDTAAPGIPPNSHIGKLASMWVYLVVWNKAR
jgi:hypothetical protein